MGKHVSRCVASCLQNSYSVTQTCCKGRFATSLSMTAILLTPRCFVLRASLPVAPHNMTSTRPHLVTDVFLYVTCRTPTWCEKHDGLEAAVLCRVYVQGLKLLHLFLEDLSLIEQWLVFNTKVSAATINDKYCKSLLGDIHYVLDMLTSYWYWGGKINNIIYCIFKTDNLHCLAPIQYFITSLASVHGWQW